MSKFREIFVKIYKKLQDNPENDKLEQAIQLWCKEVKIPQDIKSKIRGMFKFGL